MYFKKEKQFIYFGEDDKKVYTFNCNEQTFLGLRGSVLKTPPTYFRKNDFRENQLLGTLKAFVQFVTNNNLKLDFNKIESIYEATNLPVSFDAWNKEQIIDFLKLPTKDIIYGINAFRETHNIDNIYLTGSFIERITTILLGKKLNLPPTITDLSLIKAIEKNRDFTYYMYELQAMINVRFYLGGYINSLLEWCEILNKPIKEKGKTFFEYYIKIQKEYLAKKDEILQKKLKNCNNKLKFEDNNYIVIIPTTIEEYKNEANSQHNCVFDLYMEKVANKETNVVFVRKKEKIDESYITCEINNNYNIIQFLGRYNSHCTNEEDLQFKKDYQNYLKTLKEL